MDAKDTDYTTTPGGSRPKFVFRMFFMNKLTSTTLIQQQVAACSINWHEKKRMDVKGRRISSLRRCGCFLGLQRGQRRIRLRAGNLYFTQSRPCFVAETMGHSLHLVSRTLIRCI